MGSETAEVASGTLKLYWHTELYGLVDAVPEDGLPLFLGSLFSMMLDMMCGLTGATEAEGSPQRPLGEDVSLIGEEEEEKALSHLGEVGSSQVIIHGEEAARGAEEGGVRG